MLAMVKEKGMNNGRPKKQLNITFLIPKFNIFIYNKRIIVVKIFSWNNIYKIYYGKCYKKMSPFLITSK